MRRVSWLSGWAVPVCWLRAEAARVWPGAEHLVAPASADWRERLEAFGPVDALGGYSLGALLLLADPGWVAARGGRVGLMAPIWAFPAEAGRGGRVRRTQVRALARWLRREPDAAREDFYARARLTDVAGEVGPPETLHWGLEQLATLEAGPGLPPGWRAFAGAVDPLLDAQAQAREAPGLRVVADAGHAPGRLIAAWAREQGEA